MISKFLNQVYILLLSVNKYQVNNPKFLFMDKPNVYLFKYESTNFYLELDIFIIGDQVVHYYGNIYFRWKYIILIN